MDRAVSPRLSVVLSCFNEERSVREFHDALVRALSSQARSFEIVYVNDGSADGTWKVLEALFDSDLRVHAVADLFRNSGQAAALTAGATFARGEAVLFMDSDLQLDPADIPRLLDEFDKGYDIVSGYRVGRRGPVLRRFGSCLANVAMRRLSGKPMRDFGCTLKVVDARLLAGFAIGPLQPIRLPYLVAAAGRCGEVPVVHRERPYGRSGWTTGKLVRYFLESLVGVSERPFQLVAAGLLVLGAAGVLRLLANWIHPFSIVAVVTPGLLLNAVVLGALFGVAVSALAGEYTLRSYNLLLRHPAYIVRRSRVRESESD